MEQTFTQDNTALFVKSVNGKFEIVRDQPIPQPGPNQVTLRIAYSTIHEYDKFLYQAKKGEEGYVLGAEGSGVIILLGEGVNQDLLNRKVCFMHGAWATHAVQNVEDLMFFDDCVDLKDVTLGFINPMTAVCQLDVVKKKKATCVISTAATSSIAKQFYKLAEREGISQINIVRRDEQIELLRNELGAKYILNQTSPTFFEDLDKLIAELNPTCMFDYLAGELPGQIFRHMPKFSTMFLMGDLSCQPLQLYCRELWTNAKTIFGLQLFNWINEVGPEVAKQGCELIAEDYKNGGKLFKVAFPEIVPYTEWEQAIELSAKVATQGKVLIDFTKQ